LRNIHKPDAVARYMAETHLFREYQTHKKRHPGSNNHHGCFLEHAQMSEHFASSGITFSAILIVVAFSGTRGFNSRGRGGAKRLTIAGGVKLVF